MNSRLSVATKAKSLDYITLAELKTRLGVTGSTQDSMLSGFITAASRQADNFTKRVLGKQVYSEGVPGYGDHEIMLSRPPLVSIASISFEGELITDFVIQDRDAGIVWRDNGWSWTARVQVNLTRAPIPSSEQPAFVVAYTGGWNGPNDNYTAQNLAFTASDKSLNDPFSGFPVLGVGDTFTVAGTTNNNGTFTVITWAAGKITVSETITDEGPVAGDVTLTVRDLPADVEEAVMLGAIDLYQKRNSPQAAEVKRKRVGELEIELNVSSTGNGRSGLPLRAEGFLEPYVLRV